MKDTASPSSPVDSGLAAFQAQGLFPGRTALRVQDVAQALSISIQQVLDLIEGYRDTAGASGLGALNIRCGLQNQDAPARSCAARSQWRIPVAAFDAFVNARKNNQPVPPRAAPRPGTSKARRAKP